MTREQIKRLAWCCEARAEYNWRAYSSITGMQEWFPWLESWCKKEGLLTRTAREELEDRIISALEDSDEDSLVGALADLVEAEVKKAVEEAWERLRGEVTPNQRSQFNQTAERRLCVEHEEWHPCPYCSMEAAYERGEVG